MAIQVVVPRKFMEANDFLSIYPKYAERVMQDGEQFWVQSAGTTAGLKTSRQRYVDAISVKLSDKNNPVLSLNGEFAVRIERGFDRGLFENHPNLKDGPVPMPAGKRKSRAAKDYAASDTPSVPYRYVIIPITMSDGGHAERFVTFTTLQTHKKWSYGGANLVPLVKTYIKDTAVPKHIGDAIKEAWNK